MWAPSSIGIDDDLSTGKTGISSWTSDIELSRWVDDNLGAIEHLSWDNLLDDIVRKGLLDHIIGDVRVVLG